MRRLKSCFNPLDRGNLNQINRRAKHKKAYKTICFNPLDRGNLNQIEESLKAGLEAMDRGFQSPRSGKFESNASAVKGCNKQKSA